MSTFDRMMKRKSENFKDALVFPNDATAIHSLEEVLNQAMSYINRLLAKPNATKELKGILLSYFDEEGNIIGYRKPDENVERVLFGVLNIVGEAEAFVSTKHTLLERLIIVIMAELANDVKRRLDEAEDN